MNDPQDPLNMRLLRLYTAVMGAILILAAFVLLAGCHHDPYSLPPRGPLPRPNPTPVYADHLTKDAQIITATEHIDSAAATITPAQPAQQAITTETAAIRHAIATTPAATISTLTDAYGKALDHREALIATLQADLEKDNRKARHAYKRNLYATGGALLIAFVIAIVFGRGAALARTWPLALLGLGAITLAEIIGTRWFQITSALLLAAAVAYAIYWTIDRHRQGRLAQALGKRATLLREIVPILDQAYDDAGEDIRRALDRNIFDKLSLRLSPEDKAEVHKIRAEQSSPKIA